MFAGRTARSMEKTKNDYGYLKLPDDINIFKPEGGTEIVFDIVPYPVTDAKHMDNQKYEEDAVVGDLWWKKPIKVHRDVGPEGVQIICPTTIGEKCPICEDGGRRRKAGADWDDIKEIFPKSRTLFLIVPVDVGECEVDYAEGEVHVMDQSDYLFLNYLEEEIKRDIDNEGFPDPEDGLSLQTYWREKKLGKKVKYAEASKIDFVERDEQYDAEYIDSLPSLDDMLKILSYKEIEALYLGMEGLDDNDMDEGELEEEKPRRSRSSRRTSRSKPASSRRSREVAEDEPEDEPEEEEKPKSRRTRPSRESKKKCPFGHEFGVDADEFDDCDKCKVWEDCKDEKAKR